VAADAKVLDMRAPIAQEWQDVLTDIDDPHGRGGLTGSHGRHKEVLVSRFREKKSRRADKDCRSLDSSIHVWPFGLNSHGTCSIYVLLETNAI
jgi:hypothetical protein